MTFCVVGARSESSDCVCRRQSHRSQRRLRLLQPQTAARERRRWESSYQCKLSMPWRSENFVSPRVLLSQKWSKGKMKESVNNQVLFDKVGSIGMLPLLLNCRHSLVQSLRGELHVQATYDKLQSEVPKYKMITTSILSDRLRVRLYQGPVHYCHPLCCT